MKIYKVGGVVRDKLLGMAAKDADWVVCGATVEEMIAQNFKPVGAHFPVFLHPETKEEYALARTEKKVARGYQGFTFNTDPSVTLEQDLQRRDLTINAIAEDAEGNIIDPLGGQADLESKVLKHVSEAFTEDPVRLLRVARFYAKLKHLGFSVHPDTISLLKHMVVNGEVKALTAERVWQETERALTEKNPEAFFELLDLVNALSVVFPGFPSQNDWKSISTRLEIKTYSSPALLVRICFLCGLDLSAWETLMKHLKAPKEYAQIGSLFFKYHLDVKRALKCPERMVDLLTALDSYRRPGRLDYFIECVSMDAPEVQEPLHSAFDKTRSIDAKASIQKHITLPPRQAVRQERIEVLRGTL